MLEEKDEKRPGPQLLFALRSRLERWQQSLWEVWGGLATRASHSFFFPPLRLCWVLLRLSCSRAYGMLVSQSGIKLASPTLEGGLLINLTT